MSRRIGRRSPKAVYSIIVDGKTELWYFRLMKEQEKPKLDIKPELHDNNGIEEQARQVRENLVKGYDRVIWLVDSDVILKENRVDKFAELVKDLQQKFRDKFVVLINTPCLEFWFLLHYVDTGRFYRTCREAENELKKHLQDYVKSKKYYISGSGIYKRFKPKLETAVRHAKALKKPDLSRLDSASAGIYKVFNLLEITKEA